MEAASIGVLPFVNISGDSDKEFFADGMTEDLITGLARNPQLSVKSRSSTFAYKGQSIDARKAAEEIGADYLVEGSVRPMGDRIRITAQLIEAETGDQIWGEKYDEPTDKLFDLQDEVIKAITQTLGVQLTRAVFVKSRTKRHDLSTWQSFYAHYVFLNIESEQHLAEFSYESIEKITLRLKERPDFAPTHAALAWFHGSLVTNGWSKDPAADEEKRDKYLERALALAPNDPFILLLAAGATSYANRIAKARALGERVLVIDPNNAEIHLHLALIYGLEQRFDDAMAAFAEARAGGLEATHGAWFYWYEALVRIVNFDMDGQSGWMKKTMERMPSVDLPAPVQTAAGAVARLTTEGLEAIETCLRQSVELMPGYEVPAAFLASLLAVTGRHDEAQVMRAKVMQINPNFELQNLDYIFSMNPNREFSEWSKRALQTVWDEA